MIPIPFLQYVSNDTTIPSGPNTFSTGAYGGLFMVPYNWSGSTASGRSFGITVESLTDTTSFYDTTSLYTLPYSVYNDDDQYPIFGIQTTLYWLNAKAPFKGAGNNSYDVTNNVYSRTFLSETNTNATAPWAPMTTGWCYITFGLKANKKVSLYSGNVTGGTKYSALFYNGALSGSDVVFQYGGSYSTYMSVF